MDKDLTVYCVDSQGFFTESLAQSSQDPIPPGSTFKPPPESNGLLFPKLVNWEWVLTEKSPLPSEADEALLRLKEARKFVVSNITVTTSAGNVFDGNEDAQSRMSRAIVAMEANDTLPWVLASNTVISVTRDELKEALRLAGLEMTRIWVEPYA